MNLRNTYVHFDELDKLPPLNRKNYLTAYICRTCGVQYAPSERPPDQCQICTDERQYIGWKGQEWTTIPQLMADGHTLEFRELEPNLTGLRTTPKLGIGQRSLLIQTGAGNVMWDCQGFIDDHAVESIRKLGGITAIAASHPHFYGCLIEWSRAFGNSPVYLPKADQEWIMRPDPVIRFWNTKAEIVPGITLLQIGGHFDGSTVLHWAAGASGRGALLVGDSIMVVPDRRYVSFMRSYPNLIPLPVASIQHILNVLEPYEFERIYGGWWELEVREDGKQAVSKSAQRYMSWIRNELRG